LVRCAYVAVSRWSRKLRIWSELLMCVSTVLCLMA
jgi:hypothetical protein